MDHTKAALAAGIAGGYLLGRNRKAKVALAVATYVIGRRFPLTPRHLAEEGMRRLREHPQFGELSERMRGDLLESGRTALSAAAARRVDAFTETLRQGTRELNGSSPEAADARDAADGPDEEEEQEEEQEKPRKAAKKSAGRARSGKSGTKSGGSGEKSGARGKRSTARKDS
ncbi:hypothetical protein MTQ13_12645 [Streptomyces sp. XM4011]|uniref:hypothetical protein n=1 Tax=Streptomyces sp. XM4011 TaxID=2929780 RepID=UPI001FFB49FD|nr:hypothetical protein [Streptomyces sp. XM4011]MCK1815119.1 hypothetical protein [Streptomyces sp. XM4011]